MVIFSSDHSVISGPINLHPLHKACVSMIHPPILGDIVELILTLSEPHVGQLIMIYNEKLSNIPIGVNFSVYSILAMPTSDTVFTQISPESHLEI